MEDFVDFNLAKKLKEKGFQEECLCHYVDVDLVYNIESPIANNQLWFCHNKYDNIWHRDNYDAPTISQVLKWLREEHNLYVSPQFLTFGAKEIYNLWNFSIIDLKNNALLFPKSESYSDYYKDYEQAALAGIEYVLDNLI